MLRIQLSVSCNGAKCSPCQLVITAHARQQGLTNPADPINLWV